MEYAAFISYSHADEQAARWLHRKLESYRTPRALVGRQGRHGPIQRRLGKVFRDRDEFAAGGELTAEIQDALRRSASLIVLCSPRSAASRYVAAEIEAFRSLARGGRIIPVILDGEPSDCYPTPLREADELLGADLRPGRDGKEAGLLRLLAGLHGVAFDELAQRERVAQRLRMRLATGAVVLFAGLGPPGSASSNPMLPAIRTRVCGRHFSFSAWGPPSYPLQANVLSSGGSMPRTPGRGLRRKSIVAICRYAQLSRMPRAEGCCCWRIWITGKSLRESIR